MKVQLFMAVAAIFFTACKKGGDKDPDPVFADLFKNTEWTGEIKYNAMPVAEPFAAEFSPNSQIMWHERTGSYYGYYILNNATREVTISFANNAKFTATITSDNKFSNIVHAGAYAWKINNGMLNKSGKQVLDNTTWESQGATHRITFKPNQKVNVNSFTEQSYGRSGCAIKKFMTGSNEYFLVLQPGNTLKGIEASLLGGVYKSFECTKL